MTDLAKVRCGDSLSIALAVCAFIGLSVVLLSGIQPGTAGISIPLQDRVRGSNPAWSAPKDGTCTSLNVTTYNGSFPPPAAVSGFGACTAVGQPCITCVDAFSYIATAAPSNPGIQEKFPRAFDCGDEGGGSIGPCMFNTDTGKYFCTVDAVYDCTTYAITYAQQGGGG
jgi:hypothetical protein